MITIFNAANGMRDVSVSYRITSSSDGMELYSAKGAALRVVGSSTEVLRLTTPELSPKLWSPHEPHLYVLEVALMAGNAVLDQHKTTFGFRTFTTDKGRLMLNRRPFWLRGANHFPNTLRPNDKELAKHFMQLAKAGNVVATRSHTVPYTSRWLEAADEAGMAVSYEGTWPWLMLEGELPSKGLLSVWKSEFLSLIHKHRNHPSLILWTVNNEMKFEVLERKNPILLREKWEVLSDMVRSIRETDPTRPVVCDSSYCRQEIGAKYQNLVRPNDFDDGDTPAVCVLRRTRSLLHAGAKLPSLFPDQVKNFRTCPGEIVFMHIPESPAFDGLEPLDLAWFELGAGRLPRACRGTYQI